MTIEDRLIELEIKLTRQEDMVDALNQLAYRQQQKIDELEAVCAALAAQCREMRQTASERMPANEPPPHY